MTEETLAGLDFEGDVIADDATVDLDPGIEKVKAEYEERIKGFQRTLAERDRKLAEKEARERELKLASLPEDERYAAIQAEYEEKLRETQVELELMKLESKYGKAMPLYRKLISIGSIEDQLAYLETLAGGSQDSLEPEGLRPPAVDSNPPSRSSAAMVNGVRMDEALADRILKAVGKRR